MVTLHARGEGTQNVFCYNRHKILKFTFPKNIEIIWFFPIWNWSYEIFVIYVGCVDKPNQKGELIMKYQFRKIHFFISKITFYAFSAIFCLWNGLIELNRPIFQVYVGVNLICRHHSIIFKMFLIDIIDFATRPVLLKWL